MEKTIEKLNLFKIYKFALDENRNKERWQCDVEIAINIRKFQDHSISELIPDNRR